MKTFNWLIIIVLFLCNSRGYGQTSKILSSASGYQKLMPVEKIYLHTDKPYYALGDTLWYKAYLLNADFLTAATRSGLLYVELISDSGKVVKRQLIPVQGGISWGNIALDDQDFKEGSYTLRAYTNWMRNFGETYFFTKQIQLYHPVSSHWLVKSKRKFDQNKIALHLEPTRMNGDPLILREVGLKVINGNKNIYQGRADTKLDGTLDVDFTIPEKPEKLTLQLTDLRPGEGNQRLDVPVLLNRPEYTDLQFMPEGGSLLSGLPSKVAFKAIGENGRSVEISGKVYDSKQQQVAQFTSTHLGMGSFTIVPKAGESYIAVLNDIKGSSKTFDLAKVKSIGTAIAITNIASGDSLQVQVMTAGNMPGNNVYYLTGQSRNLVCYAAVVKFKANQAILNVPKSAFPSGIARFSLLNQDMQPLNERLVYINHHDNLRISITPSRPGYQTYDSVALNIEVKDQMGKPVQGSFSLSVTDDGQVKTDTADNIITHMLLTGDLKGEVEDPAYYFTGSANAITDLDNLLLTQGWTGYDWKDVFNPKPPVPQYSAEPEYVIRGKVTNALNRPVVKSKVSLLSKKPFMVTDTLTDAQGVFTFKNINPVDTAQFFIQARNKSGGSMNVGIEVDERPSPPFIPVIHQPQPWYVNTDTAQLTYAKKNISQNQNLAKLHNKGIILKEVNINAKKVIKDSHNLNGPGEADQVIDKEELEKAGKMTLGDLLKQRVKGFHPGFFPPHTFKPSYLVLDKEVRLVIDGMDVEDFYDPTVGSLNSRFEYINSYLNYYTAEDIKGIEVMYNWKYNENYREAYLPDSIIRPIGKPPVSKIFIDWAFIEITTRSGKGIMVKATPGTYLYKPLAFSLPKQFYKPRYIIKSSITNPDLRSTIHWEPNMVTGTDGRAVVSFYAPGTPGNYTATLQGADMNSSMGHIAAKIKINK